jgi:hypothetical protein
VLVLLFGLGQIVSYVYSFLYNTLYNIVICMSTTILVKWHFKNQGSDNLVFGQFPPYP